MSYFDYCTGLTMTNDRFAELFGEPVRSPEQAADAVPHGHRGLDPGGAGRGRAAADAQPRAEQTGARNLCLAGGVALNCVANGKVLRDGRFENIWIQPAAGDAGGAVGAALAAVHLFAGQPRQTNGARRHGGRRILGPRFAQPDIERRLTAAGARFAVLERRRR